MNTVEIKIPSDPKFLKIVRCAIEHLCDVCEFSDTERSAIKLAVDEAVTNIIRHAYKNQPDQPIIMTCRLLDDRLEVVLKDFGTSAKSKEIKSRELDDIRPGGLGVHLIKTAMDIVDYDPTAKDCNKITLAKYLPGKKEEDEC